MGSQLPEVAVYRRDPNGGNGRNWLSERNQGYLLVLALLGLFAHILVTGEKLDTQREMTAAKIAAMQMQIDNLGKDNANLRIELAIERGRINSLSEKAIQR